jgi:protein-tyrosine phosphatase
MNSPVRHRILFVCMGNICRSPIAENVFRHKVDQRGASHLFEIDSAGTGGWHAGEPPDPRAREVLSRKGIAVQGAARQIHRDDFDRFDLLLCMDEENRRHLLDLGAPKEKVRLLLECDSCADCREVPDPYYGGNDGFARVYDMVESACEALLDDLLKNGDDMR